MSHAEMTDNGIWQSYNESNDIKSRHNQPNTRPATILFVPPACILNRVPQSWKATVISTYHLLTAQLETLDLRHGGGIYSRGMGEP